MVKKSNKEKESENKNSIKRDIAIGVGGAVIGGLMAAAMYFLKSTSDVVEKVEEDPKILPMQNVKVEENKEFD